MTLQSFTLIFRPKTPLNANIIENSQNQVEPYQRQLASANQICSLFSAAVNRGRRESKTRA
jgi:hypothetical protein